jgi:protein gp37
MAEQSLGHCREEEFSVVVLWDYYMLSAPLRAKKPWRILVAPQGDLFHEEVPFWFFVKVAAVMKKTPHHTYFLLTKRPVRMKEYLERCMPLGLWPLPNVNIGVSTENQEFYDKRMPVFVTIPVADLAYRYVACEPLLGPITLGVYGHYIGWLVYGPERATSSRPMKREWGDALVRECMEELYIPFYRHRSHKPWKLQTVRQQQRRQQEEGMKIEILDRVPNDSSTKLVLDKSLLDSELVKAIRLDAAVIVFTKPGELGDKSVPVPIHMASEPLAKPQAKRKAPKKQFKTVKDLVKFIEEKGMSRAEFCEAAEVGLSTFYSLTGKKKAGPETRERIEKYMRQHWGKFELRV